MYAGTNLGFVKFVGTIVGSSALYSSVPFTVLWSLGAPVPCLVFFGGSKLGAFPPSCNLVPSCIPARWCTLARR